MKKYEDKHLQYNFKYDAVGVRDDSIVIYSDTEHLGDFIGVLKEIKKVSQSF